MNKQRKRHISKAKFERVLDAAWKRSLSWDASPVMIGAAIGDNQVQSVFWDGFLYWRSCDMYSGTYEYYRKSLAEALS